VHDSHVQLPARPSTADLSGALQVDTYGDPAVAKLAANQHGVVTRAQLVGLRLGRGAIGHRVARGRLHRVHRGVYLVGHAVPPPYGREMAAVLACGDGSLLSHHAAAWIWGIGTTPVGVVDVTIPGRDPGGRPGVRVHCVKRIQPEDIRRRRGLPVMAPARTLLDLAEVLVPSAWSGPSRRRRCLAWSAEAS
jgi:hypothetical protein